MNYLGIFLALWATIVALGGFLVFWAVVEVDKEFSDFVTAMIGLVLLGSILSGATIGTIALWKWASGATMCIC